MLPAWVHACARAGRMIGCHCDVPAAHGTPGRPIPLHQWQHIALTYDEACVVEDAAGCSRLCTCSLNLCGRRAAAQITLCQAVHQRHVFQHHDHDAAHPRRRAPVHRGS